MTNHTDKFVYDAQEITKDKVTLVDDVSGRNYSHLSVFDIITMNYHRVMAKIDELESKLDQMHGKL